MSIGQNIAKYRKEKGMTQQQLGETVGVTNRTVSKWEADITAPGVDLIPSVASALGITLDQLFGIEAEKSKAENSDVIKNAVTQALNEVLPDMLEETLDDMLQQYMPAHSKDEYSLLVIGRDKTSVCRFFGQGQVSGPFHFNKQPDYYSICISAQSGNVMISDYETKEAVAEALQAIFEAYAARYTKIEL